MAKKDKEIEKVEAYEPLEGEPSTVAPLEGEFGREDLNAMRDKINEIIKYL